MKLKPVKSNDELNERLNDIKSCVQITIAYVKSLSKVTNGFKSNDFHSVNNSPPQKEEWNMPQRIIPYPEDEMKQLQAT